MPPYRLGSIPPLPLLPKVVVEPLTFSSALHAILSIRRRRRKRTVTGMTITSKTYVSANITSLGDSLLYTVPVATISRIQSAFLSNYGGAPTLFDVSLQSISPGGIIVPLLFSPFFASRDTFNYSGIINLEAGYQLQLFLGSSEGGSPNMGVLVTGEDFT